MRVPDFRQMVSTTCATVPERVQTARRNLAEAGFDGLVEVREGDARETLRDLGGLIDLLLVSKTASPEGPTAREILDAAAPQMRTGLPRLRP